MRQASRIACRNLLLCAAAWSLSPAVHAADPMAPEVMVALRESGVPLKNFGFHARPVESAQGEGVLALSSLNAEQTFFLASTTKVVTLAGSARSARPRLQLPLRAHTTGSLVNGQLRGDLVIAGNRHTISVAELRQWFQQMRVDGLRGITGQLVLEGVSLAPEDDAADTTAALEASDARRAESQRPRPEAAPHDDGSMMLSIEPGAGERAKITLTPRPIGVVVVNEVQMGDTCDAWARWGHVSDSADGTPQLLVRGRWDVNCPKDYVAYVRPLPGMRYAPDVVLPASDRASAPRSGELDRAHCRCAVGRDRRLAARARVEMDERPASSDSQAPKATWSSTYSIPLAQVVREINKTSDNVAARGLLLSLSTVRASETAARQSAKNRVHEWLRFSGADRRRHTSRPGLRPVARRARQATCDGPALVQRLAGRRGAGLRQFAAIAGVDGTLGQPHAQRPDDRPGLPEDRHVERHRALAGYVRSRSGVVYAVTAIVNHPDAARARSALDVFIGWVVKHG